MTKSAIFRAVVTVLLASLTAACGAPYGTKRYGPVPGTNGRWIYDGKGPPRCNMNDLRPRHFEGDGHTTGHEHLGHGHKWRKHNFKGYLTKPPCYIRRVSRLGQTAQPALPLFQSAIANLRDPAADGAQSFRSQQS